ncbi:MAG TPA: glycosyltransferase family 39 protein [Pyrinomonadaceae bacterium]|jgi:4-amino-4-deoxy-L-arabinose transferase-like glycosyltransferase|nr:glycosyltransferase family 39 protein [Pyrinomonadaceae bacterium]
MLNPERLSPRHVLLILAACVALEAAVVLPLMDNSRILGGDGPEYHLLATNLLERRAFSPSPEPPYGPSIFRTPGYPAFIALFYSLPGHPFLSLRLGQFGLHLATAYLLCLLAVGFVGRRTAFVGALLYALYLPSVFAALYHLTETLATFLTVSAVFLLVRCRERKSYASFASFGAALGLLAVVRPSFTLFVGWSLAFVVLFDRSPGRVLKIKFAAAALLGFALLTGPWVLRNYFLTGRLVGLATGSGVSLYVSAQQYAGEVRYSIPESDWDLIIAEMRERNDRAAEAVRAEAAGVDGQAPPIVRQALLVDETYKADAARKLRETPARSYAVSYPLRMAYLWSTCDTSPWAGNFLFHTLVQSQFAFILVLTLVGLYLGRARLLPSWPLWFTAAYLVVIHTVFHIEARYSLPARPFLILYAASALVFLLDRRLARGRRGKATKSFGLRPRLRSGAETCYPRRLVREGRIDDRAAGDGNHPDF